MQYVQPYDQPNAPAASFVNGNPGAGLAGSIPPAGALENPQREIGNAIAAAGLAGSNGDLTQLAQAMSIGLFLGQLGGTGNALTGALPTLTMQSTGSPFAIPALLAGMTVHGIVPAGNTGAATLTLTGFANAPGPKGIERRDGSPIQSGDQPGGALVSWRYDGAAFRVVGMVPSDVLTLAAEGGFVVRVTDAATPPASTPDILVGTTVAPLTAYVSNAIYVFTQGASPNATGTPTGNVTPPSGTALGAIGFVKQDGSGLSPGDIPANATILATWNAATNKLRIMGIRPSDVVMPATANVTLYVDPTAGSDLAGNGTAAAPFATIGAAALYAARRFTFAGYGLTIQLGRSGAQYASPGQLPPIGGSVTILGDPNNPQNYTIVGNSTAKGQATVGAGSGCNILLNGVTVQVSNSGLHGIGSGGGGSIQANNTTFTSSVSGLAFAFGGPGGTTIIGGGCTFNGGMSWMWYAGGGQVVQAGNVTVGGFGFSSAVVAANANGSIGQSASGWTISTTGTVSGLRYSATLNGTIQSNNGSTTYFPGSSAGTTASGGQYT